MAQRGPQPSSSASGQPGYSDARLYGEQARKLREHLDSKVIGLRQDRYSWWVAWREVAEYILPRRYRWLVTPNEAYRGSPINQAIIDPSATKASQVCAAGMMEGVTSPGKPWFKLSIPDVDASDTSPVKLWLDECQKRMLRVLAGSNYYTAKATQLYDLVVFGTSPMIIHESARTVINCTVPCLGEFFVTNGADGAVDGLFREFTQTVTQLVSEFGEDAVSDNVLRMFRQGGASTTREVRVWHAIEANDSRLGAGLVPAKFQWREVYWEDGNNHCRLLRARGYFGKPFSAPRWDLSGNDAYGRSPGMDAIGCTKHLQFEQRRKAQGIDKMVNPPLVADVSLKNQPTALMPGGVTYVANLGASSGMRPVYEVQPRLQEMLEDIQDVRELIGRIFFNDLFQMLAGVEKGMTAFEVARRQEEKLVVLGPVLERLENESLDPEIDRVFDIMARRGLLPPAPQEIHGYPIQVQYVSMLAEAQRAASTGALEQVAAFVGRFMAADPTAIDNIDIDEAIDEYADLTGVSPRVIRASVEVAKIRQQRAQAQQQQQAMQTSMAAVQGANTLSQTPIGQGSALDAMLGAGGGALPQAA